MVSEKEKEELEAHIKECTSCAEDLAYTKEVFHILDEAREEEVPEVEWEKSWQKIDKDLIHQRGILFKIGIQKTI